MQYYLLVTTAVIMFSFQFLFNQIYEKENGGSLRSMLFFSLGANLIGSVILLAINRFRFECTPFTLAVAFIAALNNLGYSYCSIKALGKINLSLYSVFAMLGGMALPFAAGLLFYHEEFTAGKAVCFLLILIALLLTVEKGNKGSGKIYYAGVFVLNGMSGVISKFFQASEYEKTSSAGYSVLIALTTCVLAAASLLFVRKPSITFSVKAAAAASGYGFLSTVANFFLLIALDHIPASAQYPFITGGVMIISTLICFFTPEKPSKKEIASVILSFAGIMALVLLPA